MFPVMLQLEGRRCLVVGGGLIAARKIRGLLAEKALVAVVSPALVPELVKLADDGIFVWENRRYSAGEATGYALVFAATDDREVNRRVFEDASAAGVWVNVADDPELCSFHLPAVLRRGALHLALASAGTAPFAIRRLRRVLEKWISTEWGEWLDAAARFRERVRGAGVSNSRREALFDAYFEKTLDSEKLRVRVLTASEEAELLKEDDTDAGAPEELGDRPHMAASRGGLVSLVGAGPGTPGLLTMRAYRRLMDADAVVYDRLALPALPCDLPESVELHCVGKQASLHPVPQEEINAMLIRLSREGKRVVRFKGGDPFVFGRGGEEAEALAAADLPFEVVPGVTSGIAGPAWAGIPVTHRCESVRLSLLTAHECRKDEKQLRWDLLAQDPASTLVAYMGVKALPGVVSKLLEGGMDPETPAAMVERAGSAAQRRILSTISRLPEEARRADIRPPALIVVGPTVRHAERLDWFGKKALAGRRILLKRGVFSESLLEEAGAEVVAVPVPLSPAARVVAESMSLSDIIVASREEVDAFDLLRGGVGWGSELRVWCVGRESWNQAGELGWSHLRHVERGGGSDELVEQLAAASSI